MLKQFRFISATLALMLCLSAAAFGQGRAGDIEGTVTDSTGAVIPGATITVVSTGSTTGFRRTVTSNDEGRFRINQVAPGTYKLTIEAQNFATATRDVTVSVDRTAGA